jgi:hypothetical protein
MAGLVLADWLVNAAATMLGDPNRGRIKTPDWLIHYNLSMNDICSLYDILQFESLADLPADGLASYPVESTRISEVAVNETPAVATAWRVLDEKFQDEYRDLTRLGLPSVARPEWYFADQGYIRLGGTLAADIVGGLRSTFYGVPDEALDLTLTHMPLPNFMRSYAVERILIYALRQDERESEAADYENRWNQRETWIRNKLEDRSVDRRDAIRPRGSTRKYGGMA